MEQALFKGGTTILFIGVESYNWTDLQFQESATWAKIHGFTGVAIKVADGGNVWYGGYSGIAHVISVVEKILPVIPYTYCYSVNVAAETAILTELLKSYGGAIADLEVEFNGAVDAAVAFEAAMRPVPGVLYVTTWADPAEQNWIQVINALAPCVNGWIPQIYNNYLEHAAVNEYPAGLCVYPAIDLTQEFGANDPVQIAKDVHSVSPALFVWEYLPATQNPALVAQITKAFNPVEKPPVITDNKNQDKAIADCWNSSSVPAAKLNFNSGIATSWKNKVKAGKQYGPPLTPEYQSIDWNGDTIVVQEFPGARCEWKNGSPTWIER